MFKIGFNADSDFSTPKNNGSNQEDEQIMIGIIQRKRTNKFNFEDVNNIMNEMSENEDDTTPLMMKEFSKTENKKFNNSILD